MQGRLSPLVDGRIQAFPWGCWEAEFPQAGQLGFRLLEWTLDQDRLHENPLLTAAGRTEIARLHAQHGLRVASVTGDCFMQAPFWKAEGPEREALKLDFDAVCDACAAAGVSLIVVPLVDNGRLDTAAQEEVLVGFLEQRTASLAARRLRIAFESDFTPDQLARFIARLERTVFGINYDIGNSASLGFDVTEEMREYGHRITGVHVKDRPRGGTTVPLGTGAVDFDRVFAALAATGYSGSYVLQTARAADGNHAEVLARYRDMTVEWLTRHAA